MGIVDKNLSSYYNYYTINKEKVQEAFVKAYFAFGKRDVDGHTLFSNLLGLGREEAKHLYYYVSYAELGLDTCPPVLERMARDEYAAYVAIRSLPGFLEVDIRKAEEKALGKSNQRAELRKIQKQNI